jgi:hypothetical protein
MGDRSLHRYQAMPTSDCFRPVRFSDPERHPLLVPVTIPVHPVLGFGFVARHDLNPNAQQTLTERIGAQKPVILSVRFDADFHRSGLDRKGSRRSRSQGSNSEGSCDPVNHQRIKSRLQRDADMMTVRPPFDRNDEIYRRIGRRPGTAKELGPIFDASRDTLTFFEIAEDVGQSHSSVPSAGSAR